jgi:hypothetical protein
MSFCSPYYHVTLPACPDTIIVAGGLQPNTQHRWEIKDKFGIIYAGNTTTDAMTGLLYIDVAGNEDLPKGLFMEFSGCFLLQVFPYGSNYQAVPEDFTIQGEIYDTIQLCFVKYIGDVSGAVYVPPTPGSDPIVVVGVDTVTIPAGKLVDKILINAPAGTSISAGTTAGDNDTFEAITTGILNYAIIGVDIYNQDNAITLYFSGVTADTTITLFVR